MIVFFYALCRNMNSNNYSLFLLINGGMGKVATSLSHLPGSTGNTTKSEEKWKNL